MLDESSALVNDTPVARQSDTHRKEISQTRKSRVTIGLQFERLMWDVLVDRFFWVDFSHPGLSESENAFNQLHSLHGAFKSF